MRIKLLFMLILILSILFLPSKLFANNILIKNPLQIITPIQSNSDVVSILKNVDILIINGRISKIAPNIPLTNVNKVINATGKIVMPGFIDAHDHLWQLAIKGCGNNLVVSQWLKKCVFIASDLNYDETYNAARLATYDLINTGVTTVMDWDHSYSDGMIFGSLKALQNSGLRYVLGIQSNQNDPYNYTALKVKSIIDKDPKGSLEIVGVLSDIKKAKSNVDLSKQLHVPVNFHFKEGTDPKDVSLKVLKALNIDSENLILNHVIHINSNDLAYILQVKARLTYNPLSNIRLASGVMPIGVLHSKGIIIGLGLDGGTNDNADFFSLMKVAVGLQRANREASSVFPNYNEVLALSTIGGAKVLGLQKITGSIEVGKSADLIIINLQSPNISSNFDDIAQIPLTFEPSNIEMVMVGGRILKKDGKVIFNDNLHQLLSENAKTVNRLKSKTTYLKS